MPEYLTINQVATLVGVTHKTVRSWITSGDLETTRVGPKLIRISRDQLDSFIAKSNG